jgi:ketosteroid isomerase-like protein
LHTTGRFPDQRVYRGRAGLERYWAEIHEAAEEISLSISDLRASGDRVFQAVTARGRGKLSKVPVEQPIWTVTTLRDGVAVRVENYVDRSEALEAAGLRE